MNPTLTLQSIGESMHVFITDGDGHVTCIDILAESFKQATQTALSGFSVKLEERQYTWSPEGHRYPVPRPERGSVVTLPQGDVA